MAYLDYEEEDEEEYPPPIFKGYVVDERYREFRKVTFQNGHYSTQFIPFSSRKGRKLLRAWTRAQGRMWKR